MTGSLFTPKLINTFVSKLKWYQMLTNFYTENTHIRLPCMFWSSELGKITLINIFAFKHEFTILKVAQIASSI
jgi:hypothetical protein